MKTKTFYRVVSALLCSLVAPLTAPATAQVSAFPQGSGTAAVDGYTLPRTVVTATVVVEREVILRGTYAKYAAQYLGISGAAMTDKQNYRILDASLGYYEEPDPAQTYALDRSVDLHSRAFHWLSVGQPQQSLVADAKFQDAAMGNNNPFTDVSLNPLFGVTVERNGLADGESFGELPVNRTSMVEKSTEQLAADAANAIFTLRKRRFDLVTGEMGEHVFGAGLPAALKEIDRLEAEYLSLFIGKRYTQRIVRTYSVLPSDKGASIVCRFSPAKGLVSDSDLSGRPLVIEMTPERAGTEGSAARGTVGSAKKGGANLPYRIPSVQIVKLVDGTDELARERIPVFQMGTFASAPVVF